jgi:hypothetical protein
MSNRFINAVLEDDRGYAWIGTNFGLNPLRMVIAIDIFTRERDHLQNNSIFQLVLDVMDKFGSWKRMHIGPRSTALTSSIRSVSR